MKRIFKSFIVLLILLPLVLASCSDSSDAISNKQQVDAGGNAGSASAVNDIKTVDVEFNVLNLKASGSGTKVVTVDLANQDYAVDDLFWRYTAVHTSDSTLPGNTGTAETTITDGVGLEETVHGFASGYWKFRLFAYLDNSFAKLAYQSSDVTVYLTETNVQNVVETPVSRLQDKTKGNGSIELDVSSLDFYQIVSPEVMTNEENISVSYLSVDKSTETKITTNTEGKYVAENVEPGAHEVILKFTYQGVTYADVILVNVYSNFKSVIKGKMDYRILSTYTNNFEDYDEIYTSATWKNFDKFKSDNSFNMHTYTVSEALKDPVKDFFTFKGWSTATEWSNGVTTISNIPARTYEVLTFRAKFIPITYTITYDMNAYLYNSTTVDKSVKTPTDMIEVYDYTSATFTLTTASSRDGYKFNTWTSGTSVSQTTSSSNMKVPLNTHGDLKFIASWTPNKYSVRFTTGTGGGGSTIAKGSMADDVFTYDDAPKALKQNSFTKDGYTFNYWKRTDITTSTTFTDKANVQNLTTKSNTEGGIVKLEAVWTSNTYTVTYNGNEAVPTSHTTSVEGSTYTDTFVYDSEAPLKDCAFTRTGYDFKGWTTDTDNKGTLYLTGTDHKYMNFTTVSNGNANLYAKWSPKSYTITLDKNGYGENKECTVKFDDTTVTSFVPPTVTSSTLLGYYTTKSDEMKYLLVTTDGNLKAGVAGYTNADGQWITPTDVTIYAMWVSNHSEVEVYGSTDVVFQLANITSGTNKVFILASGPETVSKIIERDATSVDCNIWANTNVLGYSTFDGLYTDVTFAKKVIDSSGNILGTIEGYTNSGKWVCTSPEVTLYAKWTN